MLAGAEAQSCSELLRVAHLGLAMPRGAENDFMQAQLQFQYFPLGKRSPETRRDFFFLVICFYTLEQNRWESLPWDGTLLGATLPPSYILYVLAYIRGR